MTKKQKFGMSTAVAGMVLTGLVFSPVQAKTQKYTNTDFAMNTVVSETLYTKGKDLNPSIGKLLKKTEDEILSWTEKDSQIAQVNHAGGEIVEISAELADYLRKIQQLAEDSQGAFDPTLGKVIRLWDIGGENAGIPQTGELESLLKETGYEKLELDGNKVTLKDGATIDLGQQEKESAVIWSWTF